MLEQLLPYAGLWTAACVLICCGFAHAARKRKQAECAEFGHQWEADYTGLECTHCGKRA